METKKQSSKKESISAPIVPGEVPIGTILMFAGVDDEQWLAKQGYMICDGRELSISKYPSLYSAILGSYGHTEATFFIPDCRGMFVRGVDGGAGNDPDAHSRMASHVGGNTGDNIGSVQGHQLQAHNHTVPEYWPDAFSITHSGNDWNPPHLQKNISTSHTGGSETRPINVYAYYIIKFENIKA